MQKITILSESCEKALSLAPELKKRCIEEAATEIKRRLDVNISTSIDDSNHKVRDWQRISYGSKGGYAVIEAIDEPSGKNGPAAGTNYIDRGHRIPKRRIANSKGYRPRIHAVAVPGRFFYRKTEQECADVLVKKAEQICEELAKALEGK